jgi:hypothetical protein
LNGGEQAVRVFSQLQGVPGGAFAVLGALLQAHFACRHHGQLGHREDAVEDQQQEDDQDF